jgi:hypothetical protein
MLNMKSRDDDVAAELAKLKDDIRRVQAGAVVGRNQVGGCPEFRVAGLTHPDTNVSGPASPHPAAPNSA